MNEIYNVIEKNKDTYILSNGKQDEKLEELKSIPLSKRSDKSKAKFLFKNEVRSNQKIFEKYSSKFSKRSDNSTIEYIPIDSALVNYICPISNFYAISVYLSEKTAKIVCGMDYVLFCEKDKTYSEKSKFKRSTSINDNNNNNNNNNNSSIYYDINAIKKETKWSDVSVQQISYSPNHLSLISQSPFANPNKQLDTNFYYPSSAGKGIDIYFIDMGLINKHEDYDTYKGTSDERVITCDAIITGNSVHFTTDEEKNNCSSVDGIPYHGIMVTSVAGGSLYGVAKKANLHMIAADNTSINILKGFDIILQKAIPHKTVISLSLGNIGNYSTAEKFKLTDLINKGFIVVVSAGNDNINCCEDKSSSNFYTFTGYRKAIAVGATGTKFNGYGLNIAYYSNYGDCVDIYAPGTVTYPDLESGSFTGTGFSSGTSCSTPLVAGVVASIMSEYPEIQFDNDKMKKTLIEMSIKNAIDFKDSDITNDTPNRFINNGKQSIYYLDQNVQCGKNSKDGNICSDGCCTKEGKCISFENHPGDQCFIENGCQSEFGYCTTKEKSIEECEKELK
ncbi:subtilisin-like protein [Anaeromyces robustus]|uniref:Subtilisin-like protein n=1 Tax=Anaeromyces robustus TaxID=1754192 RepID=A0A1Y1XKH2_9FUNG|nr:subtilisin-like protein [Anaeromyces robustus]|eukprot:ORX85844.1 subtilisin-like protein [Anaeromyces robustus]